MSLQTIVSLTLLAMLVFWAVGAYNRLVRLKNSMANAFGQIDVQLKRRYDLIPNLVEAAKKYLQHEQETLEAVIAARNQARSASDRVASRPGQADAAGHRECRRASGHPHSDVMAPTLVASRTARRELHAVSDCGGSPDAIF